jgi:osmotically-inducible protein OsmY
MSDTDRPFRPGRRASHATGRGARLRRSPTCARWLALALVLGAPLLGGCAALVVGGAAAGVAAVHDRRGYAMVLEDQGIEMNVMAALTQNREIKERTSIGVTSYNRKVLLVGEAESRTLAERAAELASRVPKVERVIDEIAVGPNIDLWRQTEDTYLSVRVKLALSEINMPGFDPLRVKVVTEDATVYLLGLVSPEEGDAAAEKARFVPGVKRVVKLFEYPEPSA